MQRDPHEDRGVLEHPRHVPSVAEAVAVLVVAAVVKEQRIVGVSRGTAARASRGETVPVSRLWHVRQVRPLPPNVSRSKSRSPLEEVTGGLTQNRAPASEPQPSWAEPRWPADAMTSSPSRPATTLSPDVAFAALCAPGVVSTMTEPEARQNTPTTIASVDTRSTFTAGVRGWQLSRSGVVWRPELARAI